MVVRDMNDLRGTTRRYFNSVLPTSKPRMNPTLSISMGPLIGLPPRLRVHLSRPQARARFDCDHTLPHSSQLLLLSGLLA